MSKKSIVYLWVLFSGAAALGYEILWIRYISIVLGNTIYSISWSTSLFMAGIALGALATPLVFKLSKENSIKAYGITECGISFLALLSFYFLVEKQELLHSLIAGKGFWAHGLISTALILPVSTLIGITFPLVLEIIKKEVPSERVYSMNTFGGAMGIVLFGFLFLKPYGYIPVIFITCTTSFFVGLTALWMSKEKLFITNKEIFISSEKTMPLSYWFYAGVSGYLVLGMEVAWFRSLEIIIGDRAYISSLILLAVLIALGISAWIVTKIREFISYEDGIVIALLGVIVSLSISEFFLPEAYFVYQGYPKITFGKICYLMFGFVIPLLFAGMLFPLVLKEAIQSKVSRGRAAAKLLFINTLCGSLGSLLSSYVIIERLGLASLYALGYVLCVLLLIFINKSSNLRRPLLAFLAVLLPCYFYLRVDKYYIAEKDKVIISDESSQAHFTLLSQWGLIDMYSGNYKLVSSYGRKGVSRVQNAMAHYPMAYHGNPKKVLTIGLGYGITAGAFLESGLKELISLEVLSPVYEYTSYFYKENRRYWKDPRVKTIVDDGRKYLKLTSEKFDIISANITSPSSASGSLFYSIEFYEEVKDRLEDEGVYSQLVWGNNLAEIFHTVKKVFNHVKLLPGYDDESPIILASKKPLAVKRIYDSFTETGHNDHSRGSFETMEIQGREIWKKYYSQKPEFIITDDRADLTFYNNDKMGYFWIRN